MDQKPSARICRGCGRPFPIKAVIEGKKRNLQKRKFCLSCSPFGVHNTSPSRPRLEKKRGKRTYKNASLVPTCSACGRKSRNGIGRHCFTCITLLRRYRAKKRAVEMLGGVCTECGWSKDIAALQFHHTDPASKSFAIGKHLHKSWKIVKEELKKCTLLCANCHIIWHTNRSASFLKDADNPSSRYRQLWG